jgi:AbrB family looped-hinge helix DNA binding protein
LGRIVIPKELRIRFGLNEEVEIIATVDGVLLKNPDYILVKKDEITDQNADGGNVR